MKALGDAEPRSVGRYRLIAELGRGGMGRVFLAAGPDGRLVAVKQVHAQFAAEDGFLTRFRHEVAASRRVSGAYTAAVVDADTDGSAPWLASVYVPGPSLQDAVDVGGVLPERPALRVAAGLAAALTEIHRAGLVHRDLKPANVLLTADGVRVIDFGIARAVDGQGTQVTRTGWLIGSPEYMSPEQAEGHEVTAAGDVFALGSVLVMACTATSPFAGPSTPRTLYNLVHAEPDLAALPAPVRRIAELCLAKDPADRPTPDELLTEIGTITPAARPWPSAVHQLIDRQHAEVAALLGDEADEADEADEPPTAVVSPRVETVTMALPGPTEQVEPAEPVAPARRRWPLVVLAAAVVVAAVAGLLAWRLWSPGVAEPIALRGHKDMVTGSAFSPDGKLLATSSNDRTVRVWDVATKKLVANFPHDDYAWGVAFSPDGDLLASAGKDDVVRLWQVADSKAAGVLHHSGDVTDVVFSPDGELLATMTESTVRLWDVASREQVGEPVVTNSPDPILSFAFSPDSARLAVGVASAVRLWDVRSREQVGEPFTGDRGERINDVAFTPGGSQLALALDDGVTALWDVTDHRRAGEFSGSGDLAVYSVDFSADGRILATNGSALQLWYVAGREPYERLDEDLLSISLSPDNHTLAAGTFKGTVWLYELPD